MGGCLSNAWKNGCWPPGFRMGRAPVWCALLGRLEPDVQRPWMPLRRAYGHLLTTTVRLARLKPFALMPKMASRPPFTTMTGAEPSTDISSFSEQSLVSATEDVDQAPGALDTFVLTALTAPVPTSIPAATVSLSEVQALLTSPEIGPSPSFGGPEIDQPQGCDGMWKRGRRLSISWGGHWSQDSAAAFAAGFARGFDAGLAATCGLGGHAGIL